MKGTDAKKQLTVPFEPPLAGYEEVKPRLLAMKLDAEESLGMVCRERCIQYNNCLGVMKTPRPQITSFQLPRDVLITATMLFFLTYVTFSPPGSSSSPYNFGSWIRSAVGGPSVIKYIWIFVVLVHTSEAAFMLRMCIRHSVGLYVGVSSRVTLVISSYLTMTKQTQYVITTFLFGIPVILRLRKMIQKARIDSITKIH